MARYEPASIRDYGSLRELTAATTISGPTEDGMVKMVPWHHNPPPPPSQPTN